MRNRPLSKDVLAVTMFLVRASPLIRVATFYIGSLLLPLPLLRVGVDCYLAGIAAVWLFDLFRGPRVDGSKET